MSEVTSGVSFTQCPVRLLETRPKTLKRKLARVTKDLEKRAEDEAKNFTYREVRGKTEKAESY